MTTTQPRSTTARRLSVSTLACSSVLALALALSGCGTKIDMNVVSKSISDGLTSQLGLEIASVTCPQETRAAKAGDTFDCEATPKDGGKLFIKVTQKDDQGNISWEVAKSEGFLDLKAAEAAITKGMKEQAGADVTVTCGDDTKLRPGKAGDTFDCTATAADGTAHTVTVTVKDSAGNISWAVAPQ